MANLQDLQNYLDYEFSSCGCTGKDYITFQTKYINYLRSICKTCDWTLVSVCRNHYEFSVFIRNQIGQHVYLSISDVRCGRNEWYNRILIRTAKSETDYHGGGNNHTNLPNLITNITRLFKHGCLYPFKETDEQRGTL